MNKKISFRMQKLLFFIVILTFEKTRQKIDDN